MKVIKNTSPFTTRELRSLLCACKNEIERLEKSPIATWRSLKVSASSKRTNWSTHSSGHAYIGGYKCHLSFHVKATWRHAIMLTFHELMHVYGYKSHANGLCDPSPKAVANIANKLGVDLSRNIQFVLD